MKNLEQPKNWVGNPLIDHGSNRQLWTDHFGENKPTNWAMVIFFLTFIPAIYCVGVIVTKGFNQAEWWQFVLTVVFAISGIFWALKTSGDEAN